MTVTMFWLMLYLALYLLQDCTSAPSVSPIELPSSAPTGQPTGSPTQSPSTPDPSLTPSRRPTSQPSRTAYPSFLPHHSPSAAPRFPPSITPTVSPTSRPSSPTYEPSQKPSKHPTPSPSSKPAYPSNQPSDQPSIQPTTRPSSRPSIQPSCQPTKLPITALPSVSHMPSGQPTGQPSSRPTAQPSARPTSEPTYSQAPSGGPTGQPTGQPSGRPTSQPSTQPSAQPTCQPTGPTVSPTGHPSTLPSTRPTAQPTSTPSTGTPSVVPSLEPTSPTYAPSTVSPTITYSPSLEPFAEPTVAPSDDPSPSPSHAPSLNPAIVSPAPTDPFYAHQNVSGTVTFNPFHTGLCKPFELQLTIRVTTVMRHNDVIRIYTPGVTSGKCTAPGNGNNIQLTVWNSSQFTAVYVEGNHTYNFIDSYIQLSISDVDGMKANTNYSVVFDRMNGLKRSCTRLQMVWYAVVGSCDPFQYCSMYTTIHELAVPPIFETTTAYRPYSVMPCFAYFSSLHISPAMPKLAQTLNFRFSLAFPLVNGSSIRVRLPGFSNKLKYTGTMAITAENSVMVRGRNMNITEGVSTTAPFEWTIQWFEGDIADVYEESFLTLTPYYKSNHIAYNSIVSNETDYTYLYYNITHSYIQSITDVWISIDRFPNVLSSQASRFANYSGFTFEIIPTQVVDQQAHGLNNSYYYMNVTQFASVNAIGSGCRDLNGCNGHGTCDEKTGTCICNDGYGSKKDHLLANMNNFKADCTSKVCPAALRPLVESFVSSLNILSNDTYGKKVDTYGNLECSNRGVCDRSTGHCVCFTGYEGAACSRLSCPRVGNNLCSNRGVCLSIRQLSWYSAAPIYTSFDSQSALLTVPQAEIDILNFEINSSQLCMCDSSWRVGVMAGETQSSEYFGPACEYRHCPSGDDPKTPFIDETNCTGVATNPGKKPGTIGNLCQVDCSNNGQCDYKTGLCSCYQGYYGSNCASLQL